MSLKMIGDWIIEALPEKVRLQKFNSKDQTIVTKTENHIHFEPSLKNLPLAVILEAVQSLFKRNTPPRI